MNIRGSVNIAMDSIVYILITALVFTGLLWFVNSYSNGGAFYEDFYAKEIANVLDNSIPGQEIKIDVTPLANVALKNGKNVKDIVNIDNVDNKVIVSSRLNTGTSFSFFNDVDVVDFYVENPSGEPDKTRFIFKIVRKQRDEIEA